MKKRLIWIGVSIVLFITIVIAGAGQYFYNVAINRSHEALDLHDGDAVPVIANIEEQKQANLEEALRWTDEQTFETVEVESYDGLKLKAVFLKNENSNGKAVILAHGYKGGKEQMPGITKFYYEQGFDILKPDARGHGESEGDYIGYGWHDRKDYQKWIQLLVSEKNETEILLHGFSMGAATVLMTSGEELPSEVKGIIADSGYTSVQDELAHQLRYLYHLPAFPLMEVTSAVTKLRAGYTFTEASALEQVKKNNLPLFIIHGDQDELVPTEMAYALYEAASGDKELWIVPGVKHTEAYTDQVEEYQTRLKAFFDKVIGE
ncbi:alpha/beta hydrolase [Bacillus sp. DJP31]|uniref:alpha/beta hydrolase n=1 Tax=Bacillus sp. DJP31 TaxID=3409789 RepID=UPI003BB80558